MRSRLIVLVAVGFSFGCQQAPLTDLKRDARDAVEDARTRAGELRELSAEELRELWAIEYRSVEVTQTDLAKVDQLLNEMGRERWDCYHVSESRQGRVFFFKRSKSNALAYLTNLIRAGAIAF